METQLSILASSDDPIHYVLPPTEAPEPPPELSIYRDCTVLVLRRFFRLSVEVGRLPSLLGREIFPARTSRYVAHTFEDAVIFVHDVERCLEQLDEMSRQVIAYVILQDHSVEDAARLLRRRRETVSRQLPEALDLLTEMFLRGGILRPLVRPE